MAPLTKWTTQLMLSYATSKLGLEQPCHDSSKSLNTLSGYGGSSISATSWGFNRMDVYGVDNHGNLAHQYWDGYQWGPKYNEIEALGGDFDSPPTAVSPDTGKMDIFQVGSNGSLLYKYYDGTAWQPSVTTFDSLGGDLDLYTVLSATVNGANPIDVFGKAKDDDSIYHKYWDGSSWQPQGDSLEKLDDESTEFSSGPAAVSWGPNRTDIFALDADFKLKHQYWDGTTWLKSWESLGDVQLSNTPTAISWGVNRLDIFGVDSQTAELLHIYWDGSQWSDWESLGRPSADVGLAGTVAATSWSKDRIDVVALGDDAAYYYKYWDGSAWQPSVKDFAKKGGDFSSTPAVVSWGENRLDIFGVGTDNKLKHNTWHGSGWYPGDAEFETLGGPLEAFKS